MSPPRWRGWSPHRPAPDGGRAGAGVGGRRVLGPGSGWPCPPASGRPVGQARLMRIVVALGGNALLPRGQQLTMAHQREAVRAASSALAAVAADHQVVVTHGNGPQVGLLAMQAAAYDA